MNENNQPQAGAAETAGAAPADSAIDGALAAAEARAQDNWNSYLRSVAELENYRKRTERELENARKFAIERFAQELVTVGDALEAGIGDKAGIKIIDPVGQPFDPAWHEAMVAQESRDKPANTVLTVIQKGYSLNGRLLRPARVVVSKSPGDAN